MNTNRPTGTPPAPAQPARTRPASTPAGTVIDSPTGPLRLRVAEGELIELSFAPTESANDEPPTDPVLAATIRQLRQFFAGERTGFDLPLRPAGTPFQLRVWQALRDIPYAHTESYGELAQRVGAPNAARAVGAANGQNPIAIVVPCHRVIGSSGRLTGYGGGLHNKRLLLELEAKASLERVLGSSC